MAIKPTGSSPFSVFGLGTLIFTGLEIAMHATMEKNCVENILIAHPILQALFTFLQMHFLFVNSQVMNGLDWIEQHIHILLIAGDCRTLWPGGQIWLYAFGSHQFMSLDSNHHLGIRQ